MKSRHVYALRDRAMLENALAAARRAGVADDDLAIVARHDIELAIDPEAPTHEGSRITGLLAGLSAVTVPTLGVSVAGAGLLAMLGDSFANWVPALAGEAANDDVRSTFAQRIEDGQLLLVVDAAPEMHNEVTAALTVEGAEHLKFGDDES